MILECFSKIPIYERDHVRTNHVTLVGVLEFLSFYADSRKLFYTGKTYEEIMSGWSYSSY